MHEKDRALYEEADWLFRRLVRKFVKERDKISVEGIALPGMLILNSIQSQGEQRLGELAEQLDFTSGAVTALCDKLEAGGYAVRKRSESDRRSVALDITDKGRELLRRNGGLSTHMIGILFGGFTPEELERQIVSSRRLLEKLDGFAEAVLAYPGEDVENAEVGEVAEKAAATEVPSDLPGQTAKRTEADRVPALASLPVGSDEESTTAAFTDDAASGPSLELRPETSSQPPADQPPSPKSSKNTRKKNFISY
ncbi:MarR family winged helix-turn-helix transcriptional regulator [Paenibacillus chitinolyticus]|uniref:MarR family winged helix-turn-helix transcriptional regulator n=1 Tax=Paenibacillus chitinolyticus TaxID=79263 RepID=UPI002DBA377D|nr:MarR family winged helix-turn-helix transcriptional regulator [Paenibacillus chitinolyticus]MEC0246541.1 MarR family winged helix-turn-helix transcriptional regulator [Paenibacillus chitinolyticus]